MTRIQKAIRLLRLNKQNGIHNTCIGFLIFKEGIKETTLSRLRMYRCFRLKSNSVITVNHIIVIVTDAKRLIYPQENVEDTKYR